MTRSEKILVGLKIDRLAGLEIGPLDKPIVSRTGARRIWYADYATRESLRAKSAGDPNVDVDAIPEIDFVISPLPIGLGRTFDYIVASHVAEHVPDLIGWLKTLASWLAPGGRIVLALPDKRFTFDCFRELSTVGQLIEAHLTRRQRPPIAAVYDGFRQAVRADAWQLWEKGCLPEPIERMFSLDAAFALAKNSHEHGEYRDCHCWVFTSESFRALLEEARELNLLEFEWGSFAHTQRYELEFYVTIVPDTASAHL